MRELRERERELRESEVEERKRKRGRASEVMKREKGKRVYLDFLSLCFVSKGRGDDRRHRVGGAAFWSEAGKKGKTTEEIVIWV